MTATRQLEETPGSVGIAHPRPGIAARFAEQHEVGIDGVKLIEEPTPHPLPTADATPAAERLPEHHQADVGDRRERGADMRSRIEVGGQLAVEAGRGREGACTAASPSSTSIS